MKDNYEVSEISLDDARPIVQRNNRKEDIYGLDYPWQGGLFHNCYGLFHEGKLVGASQFCSYRKNKQWHVPFHKGFPSENLGTRSSSQAGDRTTN